MINCIAIDDEPKALQIINYHAQKIEVIHLIASFSNAKKSLQFLKQNRVDIVFLDINMPHLTGLDLLDELQVKPKIIFTTAYAEFALESYNYNAVDYLLKPFEFDRFSVAVNKAIKQIENEKHYNKFFFIKDGFKNFKINFDEILFIKGAGNYLDIQTINKVFSPRLTFAEIIHKLPSSNFIRVHQSFIINCNKIDKIENNQICIAIYKIPISNNYKESFFNFLNV
jgi:DNA-binding LytR/AlgR family response regulator